MRLYFDENFSPSLIKGLQLIQEGRKSDDIDVCSVEEEFGRGAKDEDWIPAVAGKHGVILTQDTNIHRTRAQWELCRASKVGVFFFQTSKERLELLASRSVSRPLVARTLRAIKRDQETIRLLHRSQWNKDQTPLTRAVVSHPPNRPSTSKSINSARFDVSSHR